MHISLPLVIVAWNDANTGNEDVVTLETVDSYHKPTVIHTIGWLLKGDDNGVTLVNEYYDGYFRGRTFIPGGMVISITPYNLSKPRKPRHVDNTSPPIPAGDG